MTKPLHNRVNRRELKEKIQHLAEKRTTLSFYKYVDLPNPSAFRDQMYQVYAELGVLGRIYIAHEGINAQISVPSNRFADFKAAMDDFGIFHQLRLNIAVEDTGKSFFCTHYKSA